MARTILGMTIKRKLFTNNIIQVTTINRVNYFEIVLTVFKLTCCIHMSRRSEKVRRPTSSNNFCNDFVIYLHITQNGSAFSVPFIVRSGTSIAISERLSTFPPLTPMPSCPYWFHPQPNTFPSSRSNIVWRSPSYQRSVCGEFSNFFAPSVFSNVLIKNGFVLRTSEAWLNYWKERQNRIDFPSFVEERAVSIFPSWIFHRRPQSC